MARRNDLGMTPDRLRRARTDSIGTRRAFLRRGLRVIMGTVIAPSMVQARVLGRAGEVAPSNRITIGFVGTGRQARYANIPGFLWEADAQAVAVCDVDAWRMERARQQIEDHYRQREPSGTFRGCATFRDWRDLVARPDIDAVMISTPDHWHVIQALAALRAGKDVACEKPLTRSIPEGRRLVRTVEETKRIFRTDSEFRSLGRFHQAAQLVRNGKIGRLREIMTATPKDGTLGPQPEMPVPDELDYDMWLGPAPLRPYTAARVHPRHDDKGRPGWLCIRDYADGMMANWGAHLNDIAMWASDTEHTGPVEIEGTGRYPESGQLWDVVQEFSVNFTFAHGLRLTCKTDRPYLRLVGDQGWIHVEYSPESIETEPKSLATWKPGPKDLALPLKRSEKRDFLDAVKSRQPPLCDAEAGHRVNSLSHLAMAAIALGRKIRWDPVREVVIGGDAASRLLQARPTRAPWQV